MVGNNTQSKALKILPDFNIIPLKCFNSDDHDYGYEDLYPINGLNFKGYKLTMMTLNNNKIFNKIATDILSILGPHGDNYDPNSSLIFGDVIIFDDEFEDKQKNISADFIISELTKRVNRINNMDKSFYDFEPRPSGLGSEYDLMFKIFNQRGDNNPRNISIKLQYAIDDFINNINNKKNKKRLKKKYDKCNHFNDLVKFHNKYVNTMNNILKWFA